MKLFYEAHNGNLQPIREEEWSSFKLEKQGYEEMKESIKGK